MRKQLLRLLFFLLCNSIVYASLAQDASCELGTASAFLDINNVRARIFNHGPLFYNNANSPSVYEVPKNEGVHALLTASLWIAGKANGEIRGVSSTYGGEELWPGLLDENGNPPADCLPFDRIYRVSIFDFMLYDSMGIITDDLRDWPWQLGAPVRDGDGDAENYDLAAGDRPDLLGDQTLLWFMQDNSGFHQKSRTDPIGLDFIAMAGASLEEDLANTTFYRYIISYKGDVPLDSTYIGLFADAELGTWIDDAAGADTSLHMGFVFNGDDVDEAHLEGYGENPPALGIDYLQSPLADADDRDNDKDGLVDEPGEQLGMTVFKSNDELDEGGSPEVLFNHLSGRLRYGEPLLDGCVPGEGCVADASRDTVTVMLAGDPVSGAFWSETNFWQGQPKSPYDRTILVSSGPFTFIPGQQQDIAFGIVWARGNDRLDSIVELRESDRSVQRAWDQGIGQTLSIPTTGLPPTPELLSPGHMATNQPAHIKFDWRPVDREGAYLFQLSTNPDFVDADNHLVSTRIEREGFDKFITTTGLELSVQDSTTYYWRVIGLNAAGLGSSSPVFQFSTGDTVIRAGGLLRLPDERYAFLEAAGPGGAPTCLNDGDDLGCQVYGLNLLHNDASSTNDFGLVTFRYHSIEYPFIGNAPHDFEIRFTEKGSIAARLERGSTNFHAFHVPFELWDIGNTGTSAMNEPSDDTQLLPFFYKTDIENCRFGYAFDAFDFANLTVVDSSWVVSHQLDGAFFDAYEDWENTVEPLLEDYNGLCMPLPDELKPDSQRSTLFSGFRLTGNPASTNYRFEGPPEGAIARIVTTPFGLTPPAPASPANGQMALPKSLLLHWNAYPRAKTHFQVSLDPDFSKVTAEDTLFNADMATVRFLKSNTSYHWRLRSSINNGPFTGWSETWQFSTGTATNVDLNGALPATFALDQNYPNPFNNRTTFNVALPQDGKLRVIAYNLLGQQVATIADVYLTAGHHNISWQPTNLANGVYFVSAFHNEKQVSRKSILLR